MKKLEKVIEYLFYLFIFLIPWQTRYFLEEGLLKGEYWEYGSISLYLVDFLLFIILWLFLILLLLRKSSGIKERHSSERGLIIFVVGLLIIGLISIYWAFDTKVSLYSWLKLIEGAVLFWLITKINFSLKKASWALVGTGVLQGLIAISQFLTQKIFSSKYLGVAFNSPDDLGTIVLEFGGRFLRAYGSLPHPNILAGFLVITWLVTLGFYFKSKEFIVQKVLVVISMVVITSGLFFTFSRSGWVLFLVNFIFLLLIFLKRKVELKVSKINLLKFLAISLLVFIILASIYPNLVGVRFDLGNRLENLSITQRENYYQDAFELIKSNWLRGVGLGNYTKAVYSEIDLTRQVYEYQPVHNIYLLILAELSIFGFLIFLLLILEFLKLVWRQKDRLGLAEKPWFSIYFLSFVTILLLGILDHYFWSLHFGIILFWLILGLFEKSRKS